MEMHREVVEDGVPECKVGFNIENVSVKELCYAFIPHDSGNKYYKGAEDFLAEVGVTKFFLTDFQFTRKSLLNF